MPQWLERLVWGPRGCEFNPDFLQRISSTVQFFSVFAKNLRVVSSNPDYELTGFLLYAFIF